MKYPNLVAALESITASAYTDKYPQVTFLAEMERVYMELRPEHKAVILRGVWPNKDFWEATDYVEYGILHGLVVFLMAAQDMGI